MRTTNPKAPDRGIRTAAGFNPDPDGEEESPRGPTSLRDVLSCPEPVEGYPLERAELVLLARHWAAMSLELSLSSFLRGTTGSTELGLHRLAAERLGRIGQLLGEAAIAGAVAAADAECRGRSANGYGMSSGTATTRPVPQCGRNSSAKATAKEDPDEADESPGKR